MLPDSPLTASFLNPREREIADRRPQKTLHSYKTNEWSKEQCIEALKDPKTWFLAIQICIVSITNGIVSNVCSTQSRSFSPKLTSHLVRFTYREILWVQRA